MQPTTEEIRSQLDRLVASDGFTNADRMSGFLRYVVDRALAGESDQIKEYVIGVEVFGRDEHYDPRLDSIVRVEARRLRSKLDEYYAGPGSHDPIVIRMRRGSYVPLFERSAPDSNQSVSREAVQPPPLLPSTPIPRTHSAARIALGLAAATVFLVSLVAWRSGLLEGAPPSGVSMAVLPFSQFSNDPAEQLLADRLTDGVTAELARLRTVGVVSRTSAQQSGLKGKPAREIGRLLGANMVMEGSVTKEDGAVRVNARVVDVGIDRKFWVEDFSGSPSDLRDLERRIAQAVSNAAIARSTSRK